AEEKDDGALVPFVARAGFVLLAVGIDVVVRWAAAARRRPFVEGAEALARRRARGRRLLVADVALGEDAARGDGAQAAVVIVDGEVPWPRALAAVGGALD